MFDNTTMANIAQIRNKTKMHAVLTIHTKKHTKKNSIDITKDLFRLSSIEQRMMQQSYIFKYSHQNYWCLFFNLFFFFLEYANSHNSINEII